MDLEKLTDRARGFLQAAQTIAVREHHQRITPAHYAQGAARRRAGHGGRADQRGRRRRQGGAARGRCAGRQAAGGDRQRRDLGARRSTATSSACSTRRRRSRTRPATAMSRSSASCWRWRWPRAATSPRRWPRPGVTPQNAQRRDRQAARRAAPPTRRASEDRYDALKKYRARPHRRRRARASSTR